MNRVRCELEINACEQVCRSGITTLVFGKGQFDTLNMVYSQCYQDGR